MTTRPASPAEVGHAPTPNPEMCAVLDALASLGGKPLETLTAAEARMQPTPADGVKMLLQQQGKSTSPEPVGDVEDRRIAGPGGEIPIRIYRPQGDGRFPLILYIHGGGWVIANLDTYDASARALTNAVQAVVVSTHYRQAPEHRYPAAHDDAFAAYQWTLKNAVSLTGRRACGGGRRKCRRQHGSGGGSSRTGPEAAESRAPAPRLPRRRHGHDHRVVSPERRRHTAQQSDDAVVRESLPRRCGPTRQRRNQPRHSP